MNLIADIVSALATEEKVLLATIISSSGSTPLPPGAMMLFTQRGRSVVGTVGGGSLELNVSAEARKMFDGDKRFVVLPFELNESTAEEGMICGGHVDVLLQQVGKTDLPIFSRLRDLHGTGRDCMLLRVVDSTKGSLSHLILEDDAEANAGSPLIDRFLKEFQIPADRFAQTFQRSRRGQLVERLRGVGGELIFVPMAGIQPLIIFGGGHIGRSLCRMASAAGFAVTVVDDRKEYANGDRLPDASKIIAEPFVKSFDHLEFTSSSSIVIVTRGHDFDREVLKRALSTSARYVGMIGSGKKVAATFARLREEGVTIPELRRVHAPIGLDIGAVTAEEIAIGIVAELIRVRRQFQGDSAQMSARMDQWFTHALNTPPHT